MKSSRKFVCTALLSIGIITSSFVPNFALENRKPVPNLSSKNVNADAGFKTGNLTKKSNEKPEKIVENYYSKDSEGKPKKEFKKDKEFKNSLGRTVIKTTQTYNGVEIWGTEQNYHVDKDGVIACVVGSNVDNIADKLSSTVVPAKCPQESLLAVIEKDLGFKPVYTKVTQGELVLFPSDGLYKYAYKINICFSKPTINNSTYYIDANDLSVLNIDNNVFNLEQPAVGTGIGQSGNVIQNLKMVSDNNTYYLKNTDPDLQTVVKTYNTDATDNTPGELYSEPDSFFNSGTSTNNQKDAVDAHNNATKVTDFFNNYYPFCRNGNDDNGSDLTVQIMDNDLDFNAAAIENLIMIKVGKGSAGKSFAYALDCIAHEYTHGMLLSEGLTGPMYPVDSTGDMEYRSLHEGIADVFAVICEYYITHDGTPDWTMGEDTGTAFRNCAYPEIDNYENFDSSIDEHLGGGIITKAAYLMAEGGTHNNCSVTAIGYLALAEIFYAAINDGYLTYDMTLNQFASVVLYCTEMIYGTTSNQFASVSSAFSAVGLGLIANNTDTDVWQLSWPGSIGNTYGIYKKNTDSAATPVKVAETVLCDFIVDLPDGSSDFYVAQENGSGTRLAPFSNPATTSKYTESSVQNFTMSSRVLGQIGFSWTGEAGKRYAIFRRPTGSNLPPVRINGTETFDSSIIVTTLAGSYDYYVMKVDSSGNRICDECNPITIEFFYIEPANFVLTSSNYSLLNFSWTSVSGQRYGIYSKLPESTEEPRKVAETTNGSISVHHQLIGMYEYYIARIDNEGYRISHFSDPITAESYFYAPTDLTAQYSTDGEYVTLNWDGSNAKTDHVKILYKHTGSSESLTNYGTQFTNSITFRMQSGSHDYYIVRAAGAPESIITSYYSDPITIVHQ